MGRLLLAFVLSVPLLTFAQDSNLSTDTSFPGDKSGAKTSTVPDAPVPANKPAGSVPDAPSPATKPAPSSKPTAPPADDASVPPTSAPLPRSERESSSKDRDIDLSPPPGDANHPGADLPSDVEEMRPWNPHQADKEVEVGDFYGKRGNYRAAESRYEQALRWQWNHAEATYKLAQTEEKLDKPEEARKYYSTYLTILPKGPDAEKAKKALDRLGGPVPVTAQNTQGMNGPADTASPANGSGQKAHRGVKDRLKDLKPECVHLGNSPCYTPPSKDPAAGSGSASTKKPQDPETTTTTTSQPGQNPQ